jgi:hypothetical protein
MKNNQCQELLREKRQVLRDLIVITSFYDEGRVPDEVYSDMVTEQYERLYQIDEALKAL